MAGLPGSNARQKRSLDSAADLRWGPDRKGFTRFLVLTGVCLFGRWRDHRRHAVFRVFRAWQRGAGGGPGTRRGAGGNRRGRIRSMALVGKLFPTLDPDHATPLRTANFITQEDIGGERTESINAAELRNAPQRHRVPSRPRRDAPHQGGGRLPACGQAAHDSTALSDCRVGKTRRRANARARIHAIARCIHAARDSGRGSRRPRRGDGPDFRILVIPPPGGHSRSTSR